MVVGPPLENPRAIEPILQATFLFAQSRLCKVHFPFCPVDGVIDIFMTKVFEKSLIATAKEVPSIRRVSNPDRWISRRTLPIELAGPGKICD